MSTTMVWVNIGIFVATIPIMIIAMRNSAAKANGTYELKKKAQKHKRYVFYYCNLFTRKKFRRVVTSYASLSCYDYDTLQSSCVDLFEKAMVFAIGIPLFFLFTIQDWFITGIACVVGLMYYELTIERHIDKEVKTITEELVFTIQSIADTYSLTDSVSDAVKLCERHPCLEKSMVKLYEMIVAEDPNMAMFEFKRSVPIRLLGTLATTCYLTAEQGDQKDDQGNSKFVSQLTQLRLEADSKVRNLQATEIAFSSLAGLALTGLAVTPVVDWFLLTNIPGTAIYIKGMYGSVEKAIVLGVSVFAYYMISALRRPSVVNQVDKVEIIDKLSKQREIRDFVQKLIPKTYRAQQKWQERLHGALSSKDLNYIYTMKPLVASITLLLGILMFITFTITSKTNIYNNYDMLGSIGSSTEMTEDQMRKTKKMDAEYLSKPQKMEEAETSNFVKGYLSTLTDFEIEQQADRLLTKYDVYHSIKFHWWYLVIAYGMAIVSWFTPEGSLFLRKKLVTYEAIDDAMQLQSLMMTLQSTKFDVRKCLYWLAQEATIHKSVIWFAYVEYSSDPELALMRLKDSVSLRDMKRLVAKLQKSMYDMSIEDAFRDIALDKQQALAINEMLQGQTLNQKKEIARFMANLSLNITIYLGFMGPILLLGIEQLMTSFSEL